MTGGEEGGETDESGDVQRVNEKLKVGRELNVQLGRVCV